MIITKERYCIASKSFPLMFYQEGEEYDDIEDIYLYGSKTSCENEMAIYDYPEEYQILEVKVTYEI